MFLNKSKSKNHTECVKAQKKRCPGTLKEKDICSECKLRRLASVLLNTILPHKLVKSDVSKRIGMPVSEVKAVCNIALAGRDEDEEQAKIVSTVVRAKHMNQLLS